MVFIDTTHCERVSLSCQKSEYEKSNHLTICHRFAPGQKCLSGQRRQRFCIDPYEYPNEKGGHPPVNVSAYDGAAMCAEQGKRLCYESEWVAACEGPDKLPFPYGHERSGKMCNIDNRYIVPSLKRAYSSNTAVRDRELRRLDQSVPSGSMETCKSGFGVYDLTGNFDEWVLSERERGKSGWAGLKGGAWGHVRNACRPITTSHPPQFTYYFISFRCCKDADESALPPPSDDVPIWRPPPPPSRPAPGGPKRGWSPKPSGG
jgi:formylglycine-generating enzyme required for sulfatase activity